MHNDWRDNIIPPTATVREAVKAIDANLVLMALVCTDDGRLCGTVTDGDVRRLILRGGSLDEPVTAIMNSRPTTARPWHSPGELLTIMQATGHRRIPILDHRQRLVGVARLEEFLNAGPLDNWVVLMAGGLGTRLRPLTEECPKPLLPVGPKPILETILENCRDQGFRRFFISVNYKADMVKRHFGDGARWGVEISYLEENKRLGTAGPLSLLPQRPERPVLVMNGDLLTKVNFRHLMDFHLQHRATATMCVRESSLQVPFGVVQVEDQRLTGIAEKPEQRFLVNAGIYLLDPEAVDAVPPNTYFDMPDLYDHLLASGRDVVAFPIREYWLDIGRLDDLERARGEFHTVFLQ